MLEVSRIEAQTAFCARRRQEQEKKAGFKPEFQA
jgi:hypothetical protein